MNQEMIDLCDWTIKAARHAGADDCKASLSKQRFVEVEYRERKPETVKEASTQNLVVRIYVNDRYSSQSTSDLRKEALVDFIENAVGNTELLEKDPFRSLPDPELYKGRKEKDLQRYDPSHPKFSAEARHELVRNIEEACLTKGGDKVISVTSFTYDYDNESVVMTSNGFQGHSKSTICYAGAEMTAQDQGDRRPASYHYAVCRLHADIPDPAVLGETAAIRTLDLFGGKKIKTETLPVIVENRNVPRLLGGFIEAMDGGNIQQKRSFLADKKGERLGSDLFTLIDDPYVVRGLGSGLYDGDGFPTQKRIMVENGILKEFYIDWYYSRKLECPPTTGGTSNLLIPPGERSVAEIMKDLGRGILITGFIGGNSNSTTGDTSVGIMGHLFENGVKVQAIAEMNIADNHLKFWEKLVEVANDPWPYSSWRTPSLVFRDIVVSGA